MHGLPPYACFCICSTLESGWSAAYVLLLHLHSKARICTTLYFLGRWVYVEKLRPPAQGLLLYVVGASKSAPLAHPLLGGAPLDVDRLLEGAGLQHGQVRTCYKDRLHHDLNPASPAPGPTAGCELLLPLAMWAAVCTSTQVLPTLQPVASASARIAVLPHVLASSNLRDPV